jgi:isopenicillin-N N-acyltransferase-like protein
MSEITIPRVQVSGGAFERGRQYGTQAAERVRRSVEIYRATFEQLAGWDWTQVIQHAATYTPAIAAYRPHFLDEMRGIAAGAGLSFEDILALNLRTEIMFPPVVRAAAEGCTALVALPEATAEGHTLVAQNWDWHFSAADTVVLLEAEPADGPRFFTAVEAGLLTKTGMNSAGIGLVTNALTSDQDKGEPGVPYHAILRAILESETMADAVSAVTRNRRGSSANYLIAHRDGEAINVEAAPGDYARVYWAFPEDGVYAHSNHFICPGFDLKDVALWRGPGTLFRRRRAQQLLQEHNGAHDVETLQALLSDHFDRPFSVCAHVDPRRPPMEQTCTVLSIIMDLTSGALWIADGNPCQAKYQEVDTSIPQK